MSSAVPTFPETLEHARRETHRALDLVVLTDLSVDEVKVCVPLLLAAETNLELAIQLWEDSQRA